MGFLVQQCIEKVFKAFLLSTRKELLKTHSLTYLNKLCSDYDSDFEQYRDDCSEIEDYYIESRYPGDLPMGIDVHDVKKALKRAENILDFTTQKIFQEK